VRIEFESFHGRGLVQARGQPETPRKSAISPPKLASGSRDHALDKARVVLFRRVLRLESERRRQKRGWTSNALSTRLKSAMNK